MSQKTPTEKDIRHMMAWVRPKLPPPQMTGRNFDSQYPALVRELTHTLKLDSKAVWDSYGQGYASFAEIWLYRKTPDFKFQADKKQTQSHGLTILLSTLAPYFVLSEGTKFWSVDGRSSGGGMPGFLETDVFTTAGVRKLAPRVEAHLTKAGLVRLSKSQLAEPLPLEFHFDNNLATDVPCLFDALFFWYD
jgi:hypothetical protein